MSDEEIDRLKKAVTEGNVHCVGCGRVRKIAFVGAHPDEPAEVAWLEGPLSGDYVSLYNCELSDFVRTSAI